MRFRRDVLEEANGGLLTDELGHALVEIDLIGKERGRMNPFVEERFSQTGGPSGEHGRGDRIVEPTQRRVGRDWADTDVEALLDSQTLRLGLGAGLIEVALVRKLADNRKPIGHGFERTRPSSDERGDDSISWPIDITHVLPVDLESEFDCVASYGADESQEFACLLVMGRVFGRLFDRLAPPEEFDLSGSEMTVITSAIAENEQGEKRDCPGEAARHGG